MDHYRTRQTLIEKLRDQRDEHSWNEFVEIYSRYIYVIVRNMNLNHHDAEDLLQQILLKVWKGLPNFDYEPNKHRFRSWLCTVTKNTARNFLSLKSTKMAQMASDEQNELKGYLNNICLPEIESVAKREWENFVANLAMESIKKKFQDHVVKVFELFAAGHSITEISAMMNIPPNTISVYKKRVHNALRKEVARLNNELD